MPPNLLPDAATDPLQIIMDERNCSRSEARKWFREFIDLAKRKKIPGKSLENPFRPLLNGVPEPPNPKDGRGFHGKANGRPKKPRSKPKLDKPMPGTMSETVFNLLKLHNGDRERVYEAMISLPEFSSKSRRDISTLISQIACRWGIETTKLESRRHDRSPAPEPATPESGNEQGV